MQQQDVSMLRKEQPGMNMAMNVSSKQNVAGGATGNAALEREDEDDRGSRRDRKKKKKKKRREVESTFSSDDEESDDDADRSKSKKKATAGVTTRINIFTGTQGPPGIGMQSGLTGPNVLSNIAAPMPIMQPMPPMIQQLPAGTKKQGSKRSSKASKSKSSQGEAKQVAAGAPAVIPPAMAGLMSGPDGQDVLVIPMPPGMKLPPFDAAGGGLDQLFGAGFPFTDAQQQPKKKKKSTDGAEAVRRSSSRTAVAGTGYPAEGAVAGTGVVVGEEGAALDAAEMQRTDVEPPPSAGNQEEGQQEQESSMPPSTGAGDRNAGYDL
ncbi:hypothetical protein V5799_028643 [Amblyomma americanum]|uniref:Uncharacterized protein n=1 Tax=Amblyomma americanum TaxID=6943 RepID=A0AAQ4DCA0_AMBAM